jgi:glycosyltransferase involved in cell wall biosynthesis
MDVSVVIPLYNKAPHVAAAIQSALGQTLSPREVIVIDDGSTDGGLDIARAVVDPRVTVLTRSPPGPGGYAARNLGIERASAEWIAFLDADDLWRPHHLADMAAAVGACAEPVGCVFTRFEVKEPGRDRPYPMAERFLPSGRALDLSAILRAWLATRRCPLWTGASAFRRELLREVGLFPAGRARRGGDKDLWLRSVARAKSAYAPVISAEFHLDAVNRVSSSTAHLDPPVLLGTIDALLPRATPAERRLLRALANQEIALYARHAAGAGAPVPLGFLKRVTLPGGARAAVEILAYRAIGAARRLARRD